MTKKGSIVHLHGHGQDSTLDGLPTVEELIERAIEINSPALGLTDHGVMSGIPDFITACEKKGIKPIPGIEAYHTRNRKIQKKELEKMRKHICTKYKIVDKKDKIKKKAFNDFLRKVKKNLSLFEEEAMEILKDYLMDEPEDLFDLLEEKEEESVDDKIAGFKKIVIKYLSYSESYHLLLLAVNNQGLKDLYKISSEAHLNGFYSDPRTDLHYIRKNKLGKNIIATSACLGGYLSYLVFQDKKEEAIKFIEECKDTFHSFYLEKQATMIREQFYLNSVIDELAKETNTPKIITTDVHFARKEDHKIHDILVAGSMNKCVFDEDRYTYAEDHYLKSVEEVRETWNDEEAIQNTLKIAEQVNVTLPKEPLLPKFPIEEGDNVDVILRKESWNGLFQYSLKNPEIDFEDYAKRLNHELNIICEQGFSDYFLITDDLINAAKDEGFLVGPGRGSAAGSLVCFVLSITTLDPIEHKLIFERFLNPERISYPDIDLDVSYSGASWIFEYLQNKYGEEHVAQIGTKGRLTARSAIRFVSKALGHSEKGKYELEDAFAKAIPGKPGIKLSEAFAQEEQVRNYANAYPDWWETSLALEGHVRSRGTHAAGVVISPVPLTDVVPLRLDKKGFVTTEYTMDWIEKLLVKFDILKLDTIDLIQLAMNNANIQDSINIDMIDLNDPFIFEEVFHKGRLNGIFQFESEGMQEVIKQLEPRSFEEMGAINALYRPGPMDLIPSYVNRKWKRERVQYPFTELEGVLKETLGVWIYQEQIIESSQIVGGLSLGHADYIRKGIGDQKEDLINRWVTLMIYGSERYITEQKQLIQKYPTNNDIPKDENGKNTIWVDYELDSVPYIEGGINRGFDENKLLKLKDEWISFARYAFNKSHAFSYSKIAIQTAYLKAYYPTEFMAALLTISEGKKGEYNKPKSIQYIQECHEMNIEILPPDINESKVSWTPIVNNNEKSIRYGLGAIAGITEDTLGSIIGNQPFENFGEFLEKINHRQVNKTKVVNLIKAGAFDMMNPNRNEVLKQYIIFRDEDASDIPDETKKNDIIKYEREVLGASVTVKSRWETIPDGKNNIQFTGTLQKLDPFTSKKKQEHARVMIETNEDEIDGLIFNRNWMKVKNNLIIGQKIVVKGNKDGNTLLINNVKW